MSKRKKVTTQQVTENTESPSQVEQTEAVTISAIDVTPELVEPEIALMSMARITTQYGVIEGARYVNVREEASPTATVLKIADEGERLIVLYEDNGFYKVELSDKTIGYVSMDYVRLTDGTEDDPDAWVAKSESILTSVKKLLGIDEYNEDFDLDVMLAINSAIFSLSQLGIGPEDGFSIANKNATYIDYLGEENEKLFGPVKMYLYYTVKLGWDTPTSGIVTGVIQEEIKKLEFRLMVEVDPPKEESAGENSK